MSEILIFSCVAIFTSGITIAIGSIAPALGQARAVVAALQAMAQQPDLRGELTRTLFVSLAMIESTAIYCLVIALIILFANPFLNLIVE